MIASIVETLPVAVCAFRQRPDGSWTFPYASPALESIYGIAPDVLARDGAEILSRIHPDDVSDVVASVNASAATMNAWRTTYRVQHPGRGEIWVEGYAHPEQEADGSTVWRGYVQDITERKRSAESRELFDALLNHLRDAIEVIAPETGRILFANESAWRCLGYTREEFLSLKISDIDPTATETNYQNVLAHLRESGNFVFKSEHRRKDGSVFPVEINASLVTLEKEYCIMVARDIGDRVRAERQLRTCEERFRQLTENIREVFWLHDPESNAILYVSPAYEKVWGRTCASLYESPETWLDAIHPEDRDRVQHASETGEVAGTYGIEYRVVQPDGDVRWVHDRGFPVRNEKGDVFRVAGVAEDITERTEAQKSMLQHRMRMEGIVNSAMDGIISIDEEQRILLVNAAAETIFGYLQGDILGKPIDMLIPERFRNVHRKHVEQFGRTGVASRTMGTFGLVMGLRASGAEFPIEASISQIDVDGHRLYTVTCRDLTEKVREAEEREELIIQLQQAQKMEAFGQLAGGVAHDFNNLLTVISGYSEWLLAHMEMGDENHAMVQEIHKSGERAAALTRQLLTFSRQQVVEPKLLNCNIIVEDADKMLRRIIGEDVQLATQLDPGISLVKIDPGQLEQVIMNLAVNARDAMPRGGRLTIETQEVELDAAYRATHAEARAGRCVLMAVSDSGSGIPPEVQARIFEPFFTTKGPGHGTGLGLAVVHGIIKQSGGSIAVYSEPGVGTTFKIYLPAVASAASEKRRASREKMPRGDERLLLVEDETAVREVATLALESLGYTVVAAASGEEAAAAHGSSATESFSLLITDVVMPKMSGRELAQQLCKRDAGLKVLFISGYTDDAIVRHGVLQAEMAFLHKPFTMHALATKVREVLDG